MKMLKIGFADYYLNNWHADHYPGFLRDVINRYGAGALVGQYGRAAPITRRWAAFGPIIPAVGRFCFWIAVKK